MKKNLLITLTFFMVLGQIAAQELKPLITVAGEGTVKVTPDRVSLSVSVQSQGNKAVEVKKENDTKMDAVLKFIKKRGIAKEDFKTTRVSLNDQYDYEKKKHNYVAIQSIQIVINDLSQYDQLMEGLVDTGINTIGNIDFQSSKIEMYQSEARKLAILNAKLKAKDYVEALGQKLGVAYTIQDNSQGYYPRPRYETMDLKMVGSPTGVNETLAAGEIEITANVSVSFLLVN